MSLEERQEVYKMATDKWGWKNQSIAVIEELAELIVELAKGFNGKRTGLEADLKLIDELADVRIMIEQVEFNTGFRTDVQMRMEQKLISLRAKLDGMKDVKSN